MDEESCAWEVKMKPKISVVVPVYNVEKYLETCVGSILSQSTQDFEIILVDDGSTDNSGKICDALKEKNGNIRVIHKHNAGPSHTRNTGMEIAQGDYITFIDSDDTIHPDYLRILLSLIDDYKADMSSCGFLFCNEGEKPCYNDNQYSKGALPGKDALKLMLSGKLHGTSACALLIKRELAKRFLFPIGKFHEDDLTTYKYFLNAATVAYTKAPLYTYFQRKNSIMHKPFSKIDVDELDAGDKIYDECKLLGRDFAEAALAKKLENYCQVMFKYPTLKKISLETYSRIDKFIKSQWKDILRNRYVGKKCKVKILLFEMKLLNYVSL